MHNITDQEHSLYAGFKLLDPSARSEILVNLLVKQPPLFICEGAEHVPKVGEAKLAVLLVLPRLEHIFDFKSAVWWDPDFWGRIEVDTLDES